MNLEVMYFFFFLSYLDSDQNISTTIEWIYMKYHIYS